MADETLLPCPFCGGAPVVRRIGNDFTKKRSCEIGCGQCFFKRTVATLRYSLDQAEEWAIAAWNTRQPVQDLVEAREGLLTAPVAIVAASGYENAVIEIVAKARTALAKAGRQP